MKQHLCSGTLYAIVKVYFTFFPSLGLASKFPLTPISDLKSRSEDGVSEAEERSRGEIKKREAATTANQ